MAVRDTETLGEEFHVVSGSGARGQTAAARMAGTSPLAVIYARVMEVELKSARP